MESLYLRSKAENINKMRGFILSGLEKKEKIVLDFLNKETPRDFLGQVLKQLTVQEINSLEFKNITKQNIKDIKDIKESIETMLGDPIL